MGGVLLLASTLAPGEHPPLLAPACCCLTQHQLAHHQPLKQVPSRAPMLAAAYCRQNLKRP